MKLIKIFTLSMLAVIAANQVCVTDSVAMESESYSIEKQTKMGLVDERLLDHLTKMKSDDEENFNKNYEVYLNFFNQKDTQDALGNLIVEMNELLHNDNFQEKTIRSLLPSDKGVIDVARLAFGVVVPTILANFSTETMPGFDLENINWDRLVGLLNDESTEDNEIKGFIRRFYLNENVDIRDQILPNMLPLSYIIDNDKDLTTSAWT